MPTRIAAFSAALLAVALLASGCAADGRVVQGSAVTVAVSGSLTSLNPDSSYGRAVALNADIAWLTGTGFAYPDDEYGTVLDTSFGVAEVTARDPLTVRYTLADDLLWSDGVPLTVDDLLLAWVANSGALDDTKIDLDPSIDAETGRLGELPGDTVYFDGARGRGLERVTHTPQLGADGRSLVLHYDSFTPGWQTALAPGLPAHIVASRALRMPLREDDQGGDPDPALAAQATAALRAAILDGDRERLHEIAGVWNSGFDLAGVVPDPELLVASGPYRVSGITDGEVTLTANPRYRGSRAPTVETITVTTLNDPEELVRRFAAGTLDVANPSAAPSTAPELVAELAALPGVRVVTGSESVGEHLDLQFSGSRSGVFDNARVREAFLSVVPRQLILDELVTPVRADAELLDSFVFREGAPGYREAVASNGSDRFADTDLKRAIWLLAKAGVDSPEVCILYDPADARRVATFALIKESAARAGFRVTDCARTEWKSLLGVAGAYDAALFAWDTTRLGSSAVAAVFRSDASLANLNRYRNPEADLLVDAVLGTDDPETQRSALTELDALLWADSYGVPLYAHPALTVVSDRVEGVTRSPLARGVLWNAWAWTPAQPTATP